MTLPPNKLDGATVRLFVILSDRHRKTGAAKHVVDGHVIQSVPALAICQYNDDPSAYLFYCDEHWEVITDDLYSSITEALEEACRQYEGLKQDDWTMSVP